MTSYNATEFKAKCLQILDRLRPEGIVVTKRGKAKDLSLKSTKSMKNKCF